MGIKLHVKLFNHFQLFFINLYKEARVKNWVAIEKTISWEKTKVCLVEDIRSNVRFYKNYF